MNDKKIKNFKYLIIIILILVLGITSIYLSTSYGLFRKKQDLTRIDFVAGNLNYEIKSTSLTNKRITIPKNSHENIKITVKSVNEIESKYMLNYKYITSVSDSEKNNFDVGYSYLSNNTSYDLIKPNEEKEIFVTIVNNNSKDIEIEFDVEGGLKNNEIELASSKTKVDKSKYLIDYSGNERHGTFMNGASIEYDTIEKKYGIVFDGVNDYVKLPTLPETIDWENGFTIEFDIKWGDEKDRQYIINFYNGIESIGIYNHEGSSVDKLDFNYTNLDFLTSGAWIYKSVKSIDFNTHSTHKIEYVKGENINRLRFYKNGNLIDESYETSRNIVNTSFKEGYIGSVSSGKYLNGTIYSLKITEADGDVVLWYNPSQQWEATNLIVNGSFENDFKGWNNWCANGNTSTISATNVYSKSKTLYIKDILNNGAVWLYQPIKIKTGNVAYSSLMNYYISGYFAVSLNLNGGSPTSMSIGFSNSTVNKYVKKSMRNITRENDRFQLGISSSNVGESYVDDVLLLDLTSIFGSGNEPSKEWLDKNVNWFDGTKIIYKTDFD